MAEEAAKLTPEEKLLEVLFGKRPKRKGSQKPLTEEEQAALKQKIDGVLKTLTYREREIIKLRYGLGDGYTYTLEEVGRIFKQTRDRIQQIEAKAVRKLMHPVRQKKLDEAFGGDKSADQ